MLVVFTVNHKLVSPVTDVTRLRLVSVRMAPAPEGNPDTSKVAFVTPARFTRFVITVALVELIGTVTRTCAIRKRIACAWAGKVAARRSSRANIRQLILGTVVFGMFVLAEN